MLPDGAVPGGAPMNVAIHLKRQGLNPLMISSTGDDENGKELRDFIRNSGISPEYIQIDSGLPTSRVLVKIDSEKNATYEICEPVAWDNIRFTNEVEELASKTDLIVFGTLALRNEATRNTLLQFIEHSPAKRFLDVNFRPPYDSQEITEQMLSLSHFVKLNDDELKIIAARHSVTGSEAGLIKWFSEKYNCELLCVTRGSKGAVLYVNEEFFEHPGFIVKVEDTVGAGDSFLAGLIAKLIKGDEPFKALEYACATGAFVASCKGAVPEYLPSDIEKLIKLADSSKS